MKMQQTSTTFGRPDVEIFYDGQLNVDYTTGVGVVNIPEQKKHWMVDLLLRGYEVIQESDSGEATPKVASTTRKKAKNG